MRGVDWFKSLLPNGLAYRLPFGSNHRGLFQGIGTTADDAETDSSNILFDIFPANTRALEEWEAQFGLPSTTASEAERRQRLTAEWRALGGQSPGYTQDVLQAAGFDVFVHEWWEIQAGPLEFELGLDATPCVGTACTGRVSELGDGFSELGGTVENVRVQRDPRLFVGGWLNELGDGMELGDGAEMGHQGYLLRNVLTEDPSVIPSDTDKHQFFWYIGGETFPDTVSIPLERREEFLNTIQKIRPRHTWIVLLVNFG